MFTIRWKQSAVNELATLWTQADSDQRKAITAATHHIERQLKQHPQDTGESRGDRDRVWWVFPLGVRFEVDEASSRVRVLQIWSFRRRG
jgi:hypothetical protein